MKRLAPSSPRRHDSERSGQTTGIAAEPDATAPAVEGVAISAVIIVTRRMSPKR